MQPDFLAVMKPIFCRRPTPMDADQICVFDRRSSALIGGQPHPAFIAKERNPNRRK